MDKEECNPSTVYTDSMNIYFICVLSGSKVNWIRQLKLNVILWVELLKQVVVFVPLFLFYSGFITLVYRFSVYAYKVSYTIDNLELIKQ